MKKLSFLLVLLMLFALFPLSALGADFDGEESLASSNIAVYNAANGVFVYKKEASERIMPGTTAKIMTALLALEHFEGRLDTKVVVTKAALSGLYGSAVLDLDAGEEISIYELLYAMLVAGMNDAANVLAIATAEDITSFVLQMNEKAEELGCENTFYMNPTGFDHISAYTTAEDTARIAAEAYRDPVFMEMCSTRAHTVPATNMSEAVTVYTRNPLLTAQSEHYYKNAQGMVVGYTEAGGYTVVSASDAGIYPYICVAMGASDNGVYKDIKNLLYWAGDNFTEQKLIDASRILAELPVLAGKSAHVLIVPEKSVYAFLDVETDLSGLQYAVTLDKENLTAPVQKDMIVGSLILVLDGEPVGSAFLVTKTSIRQSAGGAFLLGLGNVLTHPVFLITMALCLLLGAGMLYRKYFKRRK